MSPLLVTSLTFAAVFLLVCAGNAFVVDLYAGERLRLKRRLEEQIREQQRRKARSQLQSKELGQLAAEAKAEGQQPMNLIDRVTFLLDQAGLDWPAGRFLGYLAALAAFAALVTGLATGSIAFGLLGLVGGAAVPYLYVLVKRGQRLEALRQQLPDAFDLMGRVLRAGQTVSQAMFAVAEEFSSPVSIEFLYCYEQMNLGLSPESALRELGRRTGLLEIKIFVLSVVVHRQTGGNLAELLDNLSHVVRERFRIRGMISSLTAQGRFQAAILLSLPVLMFGLLMLIQPEYEMLLLQYPWMIVLALSLMGAGAMWIQKIVNFDY